MSPVIIKIIVIIIDYNQFLNFVPGWGAEVNWRLEAGIQLFFVTGWDWHDLLRKTVGRTKKDDQWQEGT